MKIAGLSQTNHLKYQWHVSSVAWKAGVRNLMLSFYRSRILIQDEKNRHNIEKIPHISSPYLGIIYQENIQYGIMQYFL